MRAVLDTNILLRALIKPQGSVGPVLGRLRHGEYVAVYSEPILDELAAKLALPRLRDKYHLTEEVATTLLALLALRGELVRPERKITACRDRDDDKFIEAAVAGEAEYVVTGDKDLLSLKRFETVRFVTPHTFLQAF